METCRILIMHLAIFAVSAIAVLSVRLLAACVRKLCLRLEIRRMRISSPTEPVFVDVRPVHLHVGQVAVDFFRREESASSVRGDF